MSFENAVYTGGAIDTLDVKASGRKREGAKMYEFTAGEEVTWTETVAESKRKLGDVVGKVVTHTYTAKVEVSFKGKGSGRVTVTEVKKNGVPETGSKATRSVKAEQLKKVIKAPEAPASAKPEGEN